MDTQNTTAPSAERYLDQPEAADFMQISRRYLQMLHRAGDAPPVICIGKRRIYAQSDLVAWMSSRRQGGACNAAA